MYFDPHALHAPETSHETVHLLLAVPGAYQLIAEVGDVANVYLYSNWDYTQFFDIALLTLFSLKGFENYSQK